MLGKRWTLCILLLISAISLKACGISVWDTGYHKIFEPKASHLKQFHGFARYYRYSWENDGGGWGKEEAKLIKEANLASWQWHFGKGIPRKDIEYLLYQHDAFQPNVHRDAKTGKLGYWVTDSGIEKTKHEPNTLEKAWAVGLYLDELAYFDLAKRCEQLSQEPPAWDSFEENKFTAPRADTLLRQSKMLYGKTSDPFLRIRYAYQILRLGHYFNWHEQAIEDFQMYAVPVMGASTEIAGWIYGHYAGCLLAEKQKVKAAYYYSRMYALSPSRRDQARLSWEIKKDSDWRALMKLCRNDREKADNLALRALRWCSIPYDDMREMQRLDPGREDLDMLLVREINKLEEEFLGGAQFSETSYKSLLRNQRRVPKARKRLVELQGIVRENIGSGKVSDIDLWRMADVYLLFLNGEFPAARRALDSLVPGLDGLSLARAEMMRLQLQFVDEVPITREMEVHFSKKNISKGKRNEKDVRRFLAFRDEALFWKYMDQGDEVKATLVREEYPMLIYRYGLRVGTIDSLIALEQRPDKNAFEKELIDRLHEHVSHERLMEIKGTTHFVAGEWDKAIAAFDKLSPAFCASQESYMLDINPLMPRSKRRVPKGIRRLDQPMAKRELAVCVRNLHRNVKGKDDGKNGLRYFLLGNVEYNTSAHGHAWDAQAFYQGSGANMGYEQRLWKTEGEKDWWLPWPEPTDLSKAMKYYRLALKNTDDPELQALIVFMMAQCEQQTVPYEGSFPRKKKKDFYLPSFERLEKQFAETEMYQFLLWECWDFGHYSSL